jgi:hypothetical protein
VAGPSSVSELRAPRLGLSRVAETLDVMRPEAPRNQRGVPAARSLAGPRRSCGVKSLVRIPVRTIDDIDGARCRTTAPINRTPASPLRTTARARSRSPDTSAPRSQRHDSRSLRHRRHAAAAHLFLPVGVGNSDHPYDLRRRPSWPPARDGQSRGPRGLPASRKWMGLSLTRSGRAGWLPCPQGQSAPSQGNRSPDARVRGSGPWRCEAAGQADDCSS